jgi:hypothetical protein
MSLLADLPEVVGFFSYSRDDDVSYRGRLSALRETIQHELSAQLGRSKANFRLWQDKEAIAPGRLWESEIKTAVEQSVFFIPIVTPRTINSDYCKFEFEAFLSRERELDRTDLVFPILYVPVPALADEALWRNHPVLSAIGRRQYVDWQTFRYSDVDTPAVREEIARFCHKIVEALQRSPVLPRRREESQSVPRQHETGERSVREPEAKQPSQQPSRRALLIGGAAVGAGALAAVAAIVSRQSGLGLQPVETPPAPATAGAAPVASAPAVPANSNFLIRTLSGHTDSVNSVAIGAEGRTALSGSADKTIRLWDLASGKTIRTFTGHSAEVSSVAFTPDSRTALSGSYDNTLKLWDLGSGSTIRTFEGHTGWVTSISLAPDGRTALSASADKTIRLWVLAGGGTIRTYAGHAELVRCVACAPDGRTALSGSDDKTIKLWDLPNGSMIRTFAKRPGRIFSVAVAPDGGTALSGGSDNSLWLIDLANSSSIRPLTGHTDSINSVAIAPDGRTALSGSRDQTLRLWNLTGGGTIRTLTGHTNSVNSAAIAQDGRTALSGSSDFTLKLWNLT